MKLSTRRSNWIHLALCTVLVTGTAVAGKTGKPGGGAGTPPYEPAIAYATWHCSGGDLYAMNADGSNKTLLAQQAGHPVWIPESSSMLFNHAGTTLEGEGMYVLNALDPQAPATKIADSSGCVEFPVANPTNSRMVAWADPQQLAEDRRAWIFHSPFWAGSAVPFAPRPGTFGEGTIRRLRLQPTGSRNFPFRNRGGRRRPHLYQLLRAGLRQCFALSGPSAVEQGPGSGSFTCWKKQLWTSSAPDWI